MSQTITVGKTRTVSFIPIDQNGNPNPVGADGQPLQVVGVPTWSLGELVTRSVPSARELTGFTLMPAADGMTCNVKAEIAGTTLALHCYADRGDGVMVHGGAIIEAVGTAGAVPVIAGLTLQFGAEV
jgi:hypothetical protein